MTAHSTAEMAQLEAVARRFVLSQLETVRDSDFGDQIATHAMAELLSPGQEELDEDWMQVLQFLSFFAAAGVLTEADGDIDKAIEMVQKRLMYLAGLQ